MRSLLVLIFITGCQFPLFSQTELVDDSVLMHLTLSDFTGKTIETTVSFENLATHKKMNFKTSKDGKASFRLSVSTSYSITIPVSTDSYEYEIPAFAASSADLDLRFNVGGVVAPPAVQPGISEPALQAIAGIRVMNGNGLKTISLKKDNLPAKTYTFQNDTVYFLADQRSTCEISAPDVSIANNKIYIGDRDNVNYVLVFASADKAELIEITAAQSLLNVVYKNLYGAPVKNEEVTVTGANGKKVYSSTTGANGSAAFLLPQNDTYSISLQCFPGADTIHIREGKKKGTIVTNSIYFTYPTCKEFTDLKKDDSLRIASRDSLYLKFGKTNELSKEELQAFLAGEATKVIKALTTDVKYFEKNNNTVCAVLYRNRERWKTKTIVTDVTGSMYPYMKEVALWHLLESMDKKQSDYVFFNDGNNLPDLNKVIGKTGGIFFSLQHHLDSMTGVMYRAMNNGSGGDAAENDLEALLAAESVMKAGSELILVADNFSPVKDIELLYRLRMPVRVVLCGTSVAYVNPDYLLIASKTGGSVHTIEEDIVNLSAAREGDIITIHGINYKYSRGRFFFFGSRL